MKEPVPRKTVYRLSLYKRCLDRLGDGDATMVSSEALARVAGVKPTQLRKDLGYCGQFGRRGLGYDVATLRKRLSDALGRTSLQPVALIGAGNLGAALLRYDDGFAREGFQIAAAFDTKPQKKPAKVGDVPVYPAARMAKFIQERKIKIAILCVPAMVAQEVCNTLVDAGIQAILNFAPIVLQVPLRVMVNNVNLAIELENLSYFIK